jgi:hypothetical protein
MSAASQTVPRKPTPGHFPGRADAVRRAQKIKGGFFPFAHEDVDILLWVANGQCQQFIIEKIQSLVNLRDMDLTDKNEEPQLAQGRTNLLSTTDWVRMADGRYDERSFQLALTSLVDCGAIGRLSYNDAVEQGVLTKKQAGKVRFAFMYSVNRERWPEIAASRNAEAHERAEAARIAAEEAGDETGEIEHVTINKPLILLPGNRRPFTLSPADRRTFARVRELEFQLDFKVPVSIEFTEVGYALQAVIRESLDANPKKTSGCDEPAAEAVKINPKKISGCASDEVLNQLAECLYPSSAPLEERIWRQCLPGVPFTAEVQRAIAAELDGCPVFSATGTSFDLTLQQNLKNPPAKIVPGWFKWVAGQARLAWQQEQREQHGPKRRKFNSENERREYAMALKALAEDKAGLNPLTDEEREYAENVVRVQ